jgi:hypothetical protein
MAEANSQSAQILRISSDQLEYLIRKILFLARRGDDQTGDGPADYDINENTAAPQVGIPFLKANPDRRAILWANPTAITGFISSQPITGTGLGIEVTAHSIFEIWDWARYKSIITHEWYGVIGGAGLKFTTVELIKTPT